MHIGGLMRRTLPSSPPFPISTPISRAASIAASQAFSQIWHPFIRSVDGISSRACMPGWFLPQYSGTTGFSIACSIIFSTGTARDDMALRENTR